MVGTSRYLLKLLPTFLNACKNFLYYVEKNIKQTKIKSDNTDVYFLVCSRAAQTFWSIAYSWNWSISIILSVLEVVEAGMSRCWIFSLAQVRFFDLEHYRPTVDFIKHHSSSGTLSEAVAFENEDSCKHDNSKSELEWNYPRNQLVTLGNILLHAIEDIQMIGNIPVLSRLTAELKKKFKNF